MRAAARRLKVRIVVVRRNGTHWEAPLAVGQASKDSEPLVLALRANHYTVLVAKGKRKLPTEWVECMPHGAFEDNLRGGGPSKEPVPAEPPEATALSDAEVLGCQVQAVTLGFRPPRGLAAPWFWTPYL